jgi:ferrochelatase
LLPLYPQYSQATTESSKKEWDARLADRGNLKLDTSLIESYYEDPTYIDALVERIHEGLDRFSAERRNDVHLVFSAHGTPMKLVRQGDPYSGHIKKTVEAVMGRAGVENAHSLCYQSKVGPLKWLEPSTPEMIKDLAGKGVKDMLLIPVAFASDHLETLFELGIEYRRVAKEAGVEQYEVTTGLNDSPKFIEALSELVLTHLGRETEQQASGAAN